MRLARERRATRVDTHAATENDITAEERHLAAP
jgi:hypothetical protein